LPIVRPGEHEIKFALLEFVLNGFNLGREIGCHRFIAQLDQFGGIASALRQRLPALDERPQFGEFFHHDLRGGGVVPEVRPAGLLF
jgi:hypothetical protein